MTALLSRDDLLTLEDYSNQREAIRTQVIAHKKNRNLPIGPNAMLYFEDSTTIKYQIQEMLRVEKIFDAEGIQEELDAYNPLLPTGRNWKATFMLEYPDVEERRTALANLIGIDRLTWVQIEGFEKVFAISNEDLERETEEKTSSVHFMRFELSDEMVSAAKSGAPISIGIDHDHYRHAVTPVPVNYQKSLISDLN